MKLATFTAVAVLFSGGYAFAGAGAPVPEGSQSGEPSGRPSAVLDDAACQNVWKMASPNGDTMSGDKAAPFIVNFQWSTRTRTARFPRQSLRRAAARVGSRTPMLRPPRK